MDADIDPPELDVPDRWRLVSEELTTPFDTRLVTAEAHTRLYEDVDLRERLREVTGVEATWRFVFASRLRIRGAPSSRALTRLVADRASGRFLDVLESRGFTNIARADTHRLAIGNVDVDATRYRAEVDVGGENRPVEAYFAVWPSGSEYLLGGGAYPLSLPGAAAFDPERGREELFEMLRSLE